MIQSIIKKAKNENKEVYIYAHKSPDGDAVNSACAVVEYLKKHGVLAKYIVLNDNRVYNQFVGKISVTKEIKNNQISLILDTSTVAYAENNLFKKSKLDDIYVIDHHGKVENSIVIEDELGLSSDNVIRDSNSSSTCEILFNEFSEEKINYKIANMLLLGLMTDTARLRHIKSDTLRNLSKLILLGANYSNAIKLCTRKNKLIEEVGIAKLILNAKIFPISNMFGMIITLSNKKVNEFYKKYRIKLPQKKIFKLSDIENCSFTCISAENSLGKFYLEFRSSSLYGNYDVLSLATKYNGGGHYSASGCCLDEKDGYSNDSIPLEIMSQVKKMYDNYSQDNVSEVNEFDKKLKLIFEYTDMLTKNITPEILLQVDHLIKKGANYDFLFSEIKPFNLFMLEKEVLSSVSDNYLDNKLSKLELFFTEKEVEFFKQKYGVDDIDILNAVSAFLNMDINEVSITLFNGNKSVINTNGEIEIKLVDSFKSNRKR